MTPIKFVQELVNLASEYAEGRDKLMLTIGNFSGWLSSKVSQTHDENNYQLTGYGMEPELAAHLGRLGRYANNYFKIALEELPFTTDMEFTFTATLDRIGQAGKTELIRMMAYDKSSGMSVVNRLMKKGFMEEFPNPEDKRGKLIRLTEEGKKAAALGYKKIPIAAHMVTKNLSSAEKQQLLFLLKKLEDFHYPIYYNEQERKHLTFSEND